MKQYSVDNISEPYFEEISYNGLVQIESSKLPGAIIYA